jgi:pimeloyl-ACP methyl ester carboxylesterase
MPYLEIDHTRYYYAGNLNNKGIPVVFCHGSGGGHHHWAYQLKELKGKVNPVAVDLPGHGRSGGEPASSVAVYRDWLRRFTREAGIGPFVPAGHSLGGAIVLDYAMHYPEDIPGFILVGSGGRLKVLPAFLDLLKEGTVPPLLCDYLYGPEAGEEMLRLGREEVLNTDAKVYYADLSACNEFDILDKLHQISRPALLICGSEDRLTPVKYSRYLEDKLPESQVVVIENAGHMMMLEKPAALNRAVTAFIERLTA